MLRTVRLAVVGSILFCVSIAGAQSAKQPSKVPDPCAAKVLAAHDAGLRQAGFAAKAGEDAAYERGYKEGWAVGRNKGIDDGFGAGMRALSTKFTDKSLPLPVSFMTEKMDGGDAYQYAVAEVTRQHFASWFVIEPQGRLKLHIAGTDAFGPAQAQYIEFRVSTFVSHLSLIGAKEVVLSGSLVLGESGKWLQGYSSAEKAQKMREMAYTVLSEVVKNLQAAMK